MYVLLGEYLHNGQNVIAILSLHQIYHVGLEGNCHSLRSWLLLWVKGCSGTYSTRSSTSPSLISSNLLPRLTWFPLCKSKLTNRILGTLYQITACDRTFSLLCTYSLSCLIFFLCICLGLYFGNNFWELKREGKHLPCNEWVDGHLLHMNLKECVCWTGYNNVPSTHGGLAHFPQTTPLAGHPHWWTSWHYSQILALKVGE